jgi:hypothetical protein
MLCFASGAWDKTYIKIASPKASSLVIGTSRASQCIRPQVFNEVLPQARLFNFAFTLSESPFGKTYLEAIKKKVADSTKNGIFIVAVDPWSISAHKANPNDETLFKEQKLSLDLPSVSQHPNLYYIFMHYDRPIYELFKKSHNGVYTHPDGWLEVTVPMDKKSFDSRFKRKVVEYQNLLKAMSYSQKRFDYFVETIDFLRTKGNVYLVRLPVHSKILALENQLMPTFDDKIAAAAASRNLPYFNYTDSAAVYQYTDGNHIYKTSGAKITRDIAFKVSMLLQPTK